MNNSASLERSGSRQTGVPTRAKVIMVSPSPKGTTEVPVAVLGKRVPDPPVRTVAFEYFSPVAGQVFVAGTFNDWRPRATPLTKQAGGKWSTELKLKPGTYEYRLIVDGQWQDDPLAARFIANPFGGLNGVLEVGASGS
jgi:1,4-alpha-glucan branching enzyme